MQTRLDSQVSRQSSHPSSNLKKIRKNKSKIFKNAIEMKKRQSKKPLVDLRQFEAFTASAIEKTLKFPLYIGNDELGFPKLGHAWAADLKFSSDLLPSPRMTNDIYKQQYECLVEMKYSIMSVRVRFGMDIWGLAAQLVNPYENLPCVASPVLNRAFFKMWEVMKNFDLVPSVACSPRFVSVHLCEGPGGFIQAVQRFRRNSVARETLSDNLFQQNSSVDNSFQTNHGGLPGKLHTGREDLWFALTLTSNAGNAIPKVLDKSDTEGCYHPQVDIKKLEKDSLGCSKGHVHYGADQTGDIKNPANVNSFVEYVLKCNSGEKVGLITADGATDASYDFSMQENNHLQLAFCEICTAVRLQAKGERYIVAREFQGLTHLVEEKLMALASDWYESPQNGETKGLRILNCPASELYETLCLCNSVIAKMQHEAITKAIQVASVLGDLLPDTFEKRKGLMSMLKRKTRILNIMNQNAYALCSDLNIPLRNGHNFSFETYCVS
ncbi:hypothetical protein SUGI_0415780 [Cryptomeria japonica]|nr:hypothetical protein SUGI_0415780 [Cryptomeria japonica]